LVGGPDLIVGPGLYGDPSLVVVSSSIGDPGLVVGTGSIEGSGLVGDPSLVGVVGSIGGFWMSWTLSLLMKRVLVEEEMRESSQVMVLDGIEPYTM